MDWFRTPTRGSSGFGSGVGSPFGPADSIETQEIEVELIGGQLRAAGLLKVAKTARFSDFVNLLEGFFRIRDVKMLDRQGRPTSISFTDLRIRLEDIEVVGQAMPSEVPVPADTTLIVKKPRRAIVMTGTHIIYGSVYLHEEAALADFVDATDPRFMPMTDVRLRWLSDRRQAGRFPFALVNRSQIRAMASGEVDMTAAGDADEPAVEAEGAGT